MKKIYYVMFCVLVSIVTLVMACEKKKSPELVAPPVYAIDVFTTKPTTIEGSNLVLPVGSRIQAAEDGYSITVLLPTGYGFLYKDTSINKTSLRTLPVTGFGTYTCLCSGKGSSCQVFYQEQAGGFGCLHQSCSGTCTGSFVTPQFQKIIGIINLSDKGITIPDQTFTPVSFEPGAKQWFFELPEVQEKIKAQYEDMYRRSAKPDFKQLEASASAPRHYVYVRMQLYGVDFYLVGPAALGQRQDLAGVVYAKASCKCGGTTSGCTTGSGGILGWKVYYCSGTCNGCQLTVTKSIKPLVR